MTGTKRSKFRSLLIAISCLIAIGVSDQAFAENIGIEVSPLSWNFGDVSVGESRTITFNFNNLGPNSMWIYVMALADSSNIDNPDTKVVTPTPLGDDPNPNHSQGYELGAFSFDPTDAIWSGPPDLFFPIMMDEYESIAVDIIFKPLSAGNFQAFLFAQTNDWDQNPGPQAYFALQGVGVEASVPEPATMLLLGLGLVGLAGIRRKL